MSKEVISLKALKELLDANAIRSATILGVSGGWVIEFRYGMSQKILATFTGSMKVYKDIRTVIHTLREYGIVKFDVNAVEYEDTTLFSEKKRPDLSKGLKKAHKEVKRLKEKEKEKNSEDSNE